MKQMGFIRGAMFADAVKSSFTASYMSSEVELRGHSVLLDLSHSIY